MCSNDTLVDTPFQLISGFFHVNQGVLCSEHAEQASCRGRGGWTCVINRHYMSRDHGKNKAKLNFEAQSLHQFAPDCTIQF